MNDEWTKIHIGDVLDFKNGLNKGKSYFGHGTPIVNYTDVYHNSGLRAKDIKGSVELTREEILRFEVRKNDVFFTRTSETPDEVGLSAVLLEDIADCVFSGFVLRGRPKNDWLLGEYCQYCFSTKQVREEIIRNCTYTTRALTNGKVLSAIEIPCPPKSEQKNIANVIASFDSHINDIAELIEKKRAIRDGSLEDLVSGRTRLNGFSEEWKKVSLGVMGTFKSGSGFPLSKQGNKKGELPFYKVSDFNNTGNERIMSVSNNYVSYETASELHCSVIPIRSIIFAKLGEAIKLERKRLTSCSCCIDNNMMAMLPNSDYVPEFICYALQTISFYSMTSATALPSLNVRTLANTVLSCPDNKIEQEAIAAVLTAMDEEIEALEAERDKMLQIREGAMDDLLTGRIRLSV